MTHFGSRLGKGRDCRASGTKMNKEQAQSLAWYASLAKRRKVMSGQTEMIRGWMRRFGIFALGMTMSLSSFISNAGAAAEKGGDSPQSEIAIMQALLGEVRQLRQAVERVSTVNGRVQIALQQMQLQEHRLSQASTQLSDIHKQVSTLSSRRTEIANHLTGIEASLNEEQDPVRLKALRETQASLKMQMEGLSAREVQLQAEEADANTVVQSEQNKWQDLSDQLLVLTQSLGADSAGATSKEQKVGR
jgi:chromosome segregation ATPase